MSIIEKISLILTFTLKAIVIYFFNATLKDNAESFVYFTHKLRAVNITYGEYSSVPMVNHLAKSLQEVLLIKDLDNKELD